MRRKRLPPDTRPDWRDPAMPVIRNYLMADGSRRDLVDPDYERRYREHLMSTTDFPTYRFDPDYAPKPKRKPRP